MSTLFKAIEKNLENFEEILKASEEAEMKMKSRILSGIGGVVVQYTLLLKDQEPFDLDKEALKRAERIMNKYEKYLMEKNNV